MKKKRRLVTKVFVALLLASLLSVSTSLAVEVIFDDCDDGVIDTGKWFNSEPAYWSESDGWLKGIRPPTSGGSSVLNSNNSMPFSTTVDLILKLRYRIQQEWWQHQIAHIEIMLANSKHDYQTIWSIGGVNGYPPPDDPKDDYGLDAGSGYKDIYLKVVPEDNLLQDSPSKEHEV